MNWSITLAFAVLLLSVQYDAAESKLSSVSRSPWANPAQANSLMNCLTAKITESNVLPQQEKEDLESIMDTMMSAIKGASAKGRSSAAQLQAINMAVASSLAELVVAEDAGNPASIAVKTDALSGAMGQCFQAVTGMVDQKFLGEINHLINMFAKDAATETNEIQEQEASYAAGSSGLSSFQDRSQTGFSSSGGLDAYSTSGFSSSAGRQSSAMRSGARSQSTEFGSSSGIQSSAISSGAGSQSTEFGSSSGIQSSAMSSGARSQSSQFGSSVGSQSSGLSSSTRSQSSDFGSSGRSQSLGFSSSADGSQLSGYNSIARSQTGFGPILGGPSSLLAMSGQSGLISRVANALANTETMRNVLRSSAAQGTLNGVVQGTIHSLARSLGLEEDNLLRLAQQSIAQVPLGSDTSAYTQALSTALVNGGVLTESNIDILGSRVFSSVLNGMSSAAQSYGMNVDTSSVQNDISSSSSFLSSGASSASSSMASSGSSSSGFSSTAGSQSAMSSGARSQSTEFGSSSGIQSSAMSSGARSQSSQFGSAAGSQSLGLSSSAASDSRASQFSSGRSQADYSQAGRYSSLGRSQANFNQAGDLVSSVASPLAGISLRSTLSLPNGLRSGSAAARISQLTSSLGNAITPNGVDANAIARSLQSSFSNLQRSGMSASDAKIESLMESVVGLLQLLSNTEVRGVNMANAASVTDSVTKSFELALA